MPSARSLGRLKVVFLVFAGTAVDFLFSRSRVDLVVDFHRQLPVATCLAH